jgi:hypothetical protein
MSNIAITMHRQRNRAGGKKKKKKKKKKKPWHNVAVVQKANLHGQESAIIFLQQRKTRLG